MGSLNFIGLGTYDEKGMTLYGLELARNCEIIFLEHYTSLMPYLNLESLERIIGKKIIIIDRKYLEDGSAILRNAMEKDVAILIPGDPFIATTHIDLRIRAEKQNIKVRVAHAPSIISIVPGETGLQNYKFGKSATITFPDNYSEVPYDTLKQNLSLGLHTLLFLDIKVDEGKYMTANDGMAILMEIENRRKEGIIKSNTLVIGIARAGGPNQLIKGDVIEKLICFDFGPPPHCLVFPGRLHFMEAEALVMLAKVDRELLKVI
ncbi:MAG: diphthine synthase [Candidatus Methanomethyliaceae archaeon]|nr:diphthine synthase [Candidatus Methanomethyliaceae archaeon]MDW7971034.1 diphthine synthase [Nitrososphaerota archaeon]